MTGIVLFMVQSPLLFLNGCIPLNVNTDSVAVRASRSPVPDCL